MYFTGYSGPFLRLCDGEQTLGGARPRLESFARGRAACAGYIHRKKEA